MSSKEVNRVLYSAENKAIYRMALWAISFQLVTLALLIQYTVIHTAENRGLLVWMALCTLLLVVGLTTVYRFYHSAVTRQGSLRWQRNHRILALLNIALWAVLPPILFSTPPQHPYALLTLLLIASATQIAMPLHGIRYGVATMIIVPFSLAIATINILPEYTAALLIYGMTAIIIQHLLLRNIHNTLEFEKESKRLQDKLIRTETFFTHASHLTGLAYWELDLKSGALTWSDAAYALFGLPSGTPLTGPCVMGAIYWDDRNLYQRTLREALAGKATINREFRVIHPDGSVRVLRDSGEVVIDADGKSRLMLGVMHDITGQVDAKEKLRAAYGELSRILDHMQDTYYHADPSGRLVMISPSVEKLLGYRAEECIGKRIAELYSSSRHGQLFLIDLNSHQGTLRNYQIEMRHKDGRHIWASVNAQFIRDDKNHVVGIEGTMRDITQLRQTENALHKERERAMITLHSIADGVITTNTDGIIQYLNPAAERLLGIELAAATGHAYFEVMKLYDEESGAQLADIVKQSISFQENSVRSYDGMLENSHGRRYHLNVQSTPMRDTLGHIIGAVLVMHDVTEVMGMARQLNYQASHDALTGLYNRWIFEKRVDEAIHNAQRRNEFHALLYIDLDQFKIVNDTCGHMAGDELLQQITRLMQQQIRDADILARLGGDEFGVLLEHCPLDKATTIADAIRQAIRDYRFGWKNKTFEVGASIGLAPITAMSGNLSDVLACADAACYVAKESGRNRTHIYQPDDAAIAKHHREMEWVHRLNNAFDEQRFVLYAQAVASISGNRTISHYEVLLRMTDERGNVVPPGAFIPAAERYNLMPTIDRWVVRKTLEMLREAQGSEPLPPLECAINLSGQTLCDEKFLDYVVDIFAETAIPCESICFEITETAAVSNLTRATHFITVLKNMGCSFALDDFGAGLSSFGYLKRLPIDYLKIDGSFVRDMVVDQVDRAMVESINQIGHVMNLKTVAEFAETESVLVALKQAGVDYAQGLAIEPPLPLSEVLERELRLHQRPSESSPTILQPLTD